MRKIVVTLSHSDNNNSDESLSYNNFNQILEIDPKKSVDATIKCPKCNSELNIKVSSERMIKFYKSIPNIIILSILIIIFSLSIISVLNSDKIPISIIDWIKTIIFSLIPAVFFSVIIGIILNNYLVDLNILHRLMDRGLIINANTGINYHKIIGFESY